MNAFKGALQDHRLLIDEAADEVERRAKDLRLFKVLNDLSYEADYDPSAVNLIETAA